MRDIIIAIVLIAVTVGLIYIIRLLSASFQSLCNRPRAELSLYFDQDCECLEYTLGRLFSSAAFREVDIKLTIIDCVGTPESRQWLEALRTKLKWDFEIIGEVGQNGAPKCSDNKRNC